MVLSIFFKDSCVGGEVSQAFPFCGSRVLSPVSYKTVLDNIQFSVFSLLFSDLFYLVLFYSVSEPSHLYPQGPSLVNVYSIANSFPWCRPMCTHSATS